jgi:unsaturated rhamnogalacturonyl hydrolase
MNLPRTSTQVLGCRLLLLLWILFVLPGAQMRCQDTALTKDRLQSIADGIIRDASFQLVDQRTGMHYTAASDAPPEAELKLASRYNDWRYWNGVLNIAMIRLGNALNVPVYTDFSSRNVAFSFDNYEYFKRRYEGEGKWGYPFAQLFTMEELDDCGAMGASVLEVYRSDKQERYRKYIDLAAKHIEKIQPRLDDGTLVRSFPRKWTLWADDLYMSVSFLSRMGEMSGDVRYFDDAARQVVNFHKYLFDQDKGLLHHCWYSDVQRPGVAYWGRANGWAMVAQVDLLDRLPKDFPQRDTLLALLQRDIRGVARYQEENGLWHQLLDKADSYLETSCSAMFTYAIARAVNKGYIDTSYASIARRGWAGVITKIRPDGQIEGVCAGTAIGDDLEFYYKRPTPINDIHGIGAVLLAGAEMLHLQK